MREKHVLFPIQEMGSKSKTPGSVFIWSCIVFSDVLGVLLLQVILYVIVRATCTKKATWPRFGLT
jgi:hypothetical protein